jgi:hypothetical protein
MKQYVCEAEISRYDFDRINRLMDVMFEEYEWDSKMHDLIDELDARQDTTPYSFYFEFDDGSKIYIDISSGSSNYYDNCVWVSSDCNKDYVFDCSYEISEENEFIHNDVSYICKFIIKEEC